MTSIYSTDFSNKKNLEKYSSAFTLSDMEIFIFPELFYPLVLANIMSPIIWEWRDDPWFKDFEKKSFTYKSNRIKQFIIQNYVFNLDLSTWGLTTKSREIERFRDFFDMEMLKQSNALFGYEGDKYYFDIDIRKHFGLDKYDSEVIPYWKTETLEAMSAFRFKENFNTGAGECVSLSSLYAAAMFVLGRIPLEKIFLIATPLHSQNFIIEKEGLITNNRRIVTKNMWFNGTSLSAKARRAMENEKVTVVTNISGYIHTLYEVATIDKEAYKWFSHKLKDFLTTDLTSAIFINFLRFKSRYKTIFQFCDDSTGVKRYISLEKMFEYEHNSKFNASRETRDQLLNEIEGEEFHLSPLQGKIILNDIELLLDRVSSKNLEDIEEEFMIETSFEPSITIHEMFNEIRDFIYTDPKIPDSSKEYIKTKVPSIGIEDGRNDIINKIYGCANESELCKLTLYAYRQMDRIDWLPFIKASVERNPVCNLDLNMKSVQEAYDIILNFDNQSIYDGNRLALPDEVWNYRRGDGVEKAILLATFIHTKDTNHAIKIIIDEQAVQVEYQKHRFHFKSEKSFRKTIEIKGSEYKIN